MLITLYAGKKDIRIKIKRQVMVFALLDIVFLIIENPLRTIMTLATPKICRS